MGIAGHVQALTLVPLAFFIALLAVSIYLQKANAELGQRALLTTRILSLSDELYDDLDVQSQVFTRARTGTARAGDQATFDERGRALSAALAQLQRIVPTSPDRTGRRMLPSYVNSTRRVEGFERALLPVAQARNAAAIARWVANPGNAATVRAWRDEKTAFDASFRRALIEDYNRTNDALRPARVINLALTFGGALSTFIAALTLGHWLVRRLQRLAEGAQKVAAGEPVDPLRGGDEIAMVDGIVRALTTDLRAAADERARALEAYEREHDIAAALQTALLPNETPLVPGLHVYTAYIAADVGASIGGDWYDVFRLDERRVGISMGDVAGHGVVAATQMSAVRQSIRTAARALRQPHDVLRLVNQTLCAEGIDSFVSAVFATIDIAGGMLSYANAGHPPPLLIDAEGAPVTLGGQDVVLGVDPEERFETHTAQLHSGSALILYTDGLIEHGRDPILGTAELLVAASAEFHRPSLNPAEGVQRRVFGESRLHDDSAVLFLYLDDLAGAASVWEWRFDPRDEAAATRVKRMLLRRIARLDSRWSAEFVETIYGELASNVARHTDGEARVRLEIEGDRAILTVEDEGEPFDFEPREAVGALAESGRGLHLVRAFARDVRLERTERGNRVRVVISPSDHDRARTGADERSSPGQAGRSGPPPGATLRA